MVPGGIASATYRGSSRASMWWSAPIPMVHGVPENSRTIFSLGLDGRHDVGHGRWANEEGREPCGEDRDDQPPHTLTPSDSIHFPACRAERSLRNVST